ncbi:MAG TPA: glycosyltransferase family 2 protein [Pseudonocardia sp.]|uniref:glycosyltransferase family 2 protein n=1 Tax=Pseudonocardia sp. TaxID=60912 RepID=UPI002B4B3A45|nr:glycosyltransferase family 2 protein [Pseudonocardia sp.]HLU59338.1 glycosyltransferase family 2 protein [Pseudonocardia sp.]
MTARLDTPVGSITAPPGTPTVSLVIPVRDEERFVEACLESVLAQDYPADRLEIVLVDGRSTDRTRELAAAVLADRIAEGRAQIVDNPLGIAPTAMNLGIEASTGEVVVRADGHTALPPDYVSRSVRVLQETGAQCVGGAIRTLGTGPVGRAIAAAQSSRFGVGGVAFRTGRPTAGPVDTVPFGAWPREVFSRIGGFDPELVRNQDDELNFRLLQAGGTVWYDPGIRTDYFATPSLRRFWRQYHQYGEYKIRVAQKRGGFASPRHVVPAAFVVATAASLLVAVARRDPRWALAVLGPYAVANGAASVAVARRTGADPTRVAAAFAVLHTSYGTGFLKGLWRWRRRDRRR